MATTEEMNHGNSIIKKHIPMFIFLWGMVAGALLQLIVILVATA